LNPSPETSRSRTLFRKIWEAHTVTSSAEGLDLLFIDRSLLTDLSGTVGLENLAAAGRRIARPDLQVAVADHVVSTRRDGAPTAGPRHDRFVGQLERLAASAQVPEWSRALGRQGISHVVGIETAFTLPGLTVVCGDSHTTSHGAVGALAWGIGSTETEHVLATQTLWMKYPAQSRIRLSGAPGSDVSAKDLALWLIGELGARFGGGAAIEFAGPAVRALSIEGRATLCNLAIELGARFAIIAPDEHTFAYLRGRQYAPGVAEFPTALRAWQGLFSDEGAVFNTDLSFDVSALVPQVTWGVSPEHVAPVDGAVPADAPRDALEYMGLEPGQVLSSLPVDYVFIGSCANARIEDLRQAAAVVRGERVADGVTAWVVPGSQSVRAQAEREGLDRIFVAAGFEWRMPGCSMCVSANGDVVPSGRRCLSTSNRNFMGRQGPGARTHLASPLVAAASALAGFIRAPKSDGGARAGSRGGSL
jgi:3-isopropylmalate/(R)-2-methylmalate dehydratase large subunit